MMVGVSVENALSVIGKVLVPPEFVSATEKFEVPAVARLPEITPVVALTLTPAGKPLPAKALG